MLRWRVFDRRNSPENPTSRALPASVQLDVRLHHEELLITSERHEYLLVVEVENTGSVRVADYRIDILFPKIFLDIETYGFEVHNAETNTHKLFRRMASQFSDYPTGLYPGDTLADKLIKYSVNSERYWSNWMERSVEVTVYADNMVPLRIKKPISELQNF